MSKMMLTPTTGTTRPASADLLSQLGSARSGQDGEASAAFARLLQARSGALSASPAPQAAQSPLLTAGTSSGKPAAADASHGVTHEQQGRRQDAAKASARRSTEAQPKDRQAQAPKPAQGAEAAEAQDPVLAQVLRHLRRGDSHAESDDELESTEDAITEQDEPNADASMVAALPPAQDLHRPATRESAATDDLASSASDPLARKSAAGMIQGEGDAARTAPGGEGKAAEAGTPLPLTMQAQAERRASQDLAASPESAGLALEAAGHAGRSADAASPDKTLPAGAFAGLLQQAQAGAMQDKAAAPGAAGARYELQSPLHAQGFAPEMAARLSLAAVEGVQQAQLHLNPADMGPVQVQIVLDGQQAQISFVAEQADTRAVLEKSLPELAGALREQGLTLSGGGVFSQQQQTQSGQSGQAQHDGSAAGSRWASSRLGTGAAEEAALAQQAAAPVATRSRGVLDLFA